MDMDTSSRSALALLFESRLAEPVDTGPIDYCDVHDLVAVALVRTQSVAIYRINGQLAFQINRKSPDTTVTVLKWKPDGSLLGVGWSDGTVGLYSGEDGKLINLVSVKRNGVRDDWKLDLVPEDADGDEGEEVATPGLLGWTTYATEPGHSHASTNNYTTTDAWSTSLDDGLTDEDGVDGGKASLSKLAKSIATLDISTVLPRLSPLPVHTLRFGPSEQKFTTQAGIDTILDVNQATSDSVNTFVTSSTSGHTNVYLGDSVSLGASNVGQQDSCSRLASHPQCASQAVLSSSEDDQAYRLTYIDLPLRAMGEPLLHVVTTNTKRMQSLLSYITQTIRCMQSDLTSNMQFPSRLLDLASEDLETSGDGDLVSNFYHLAMTGDFSSPAVQQWFADMGDNKHKRWDKHVNDMYNHIQAHIFINLIPALDRLAIATDAIRGHTKLHFGTDNFVSPAPFTALMDDVDSLRLTAKKLQLLVMTEHRQFRAFSKWVRVMVDIALAGPGDKEAVAVEQREAPHMDTFLILAYFKDTLTQSKVASYLQQNPDLKGNCAREEFWQHAVVVHSTRANVVKAIEQQNAAKEGSDEQSTTVLNLPTLAIRLAGQTRLAVESITKWQSEMLSKPVALPLDPALLPPKARILDMEMRSQLGGDFSSKSSIVHILSAATSSGRKSNPTSLLSVTRSPAWEYETSEKSITLPPGELLQATFLNGRDRVVGLLKQADESRHLLISYDVQNDSETQPRSPRLLHIFVAEEAFEPVRFVIGGRPGRMVCVVFARDGLVWKVLDLESEANRSSNGIALTPSEEDEMML